MTSKKPDQDKPPRGKPVKITLPFDEAIDALIRVPLPDKKDKPGKKPLQE